jgi:hypothetical protein
LPHDATSALPAGARLATADSIPPEPDAAKVSTSFSVWNTRFSPSRQCAYSSTNAGARWYRMGSAIAFDTAGGSGVGPAVIM